MPWDQAEIWIARVTADSSFKLDKKWAVSFPNPDKRPVSLAYPNWSNDKTLIFTSDVSGFVNPWKYDISTPDKEATVVFSKPVNQDFGYPMWSLHFFPFTVLDVPSLLDTGCVVIDGLRSWVQGCDGTFKVVFAGTKKRAESISPCQPRIAAMAHFAHLLLISSPRRRSHRT